MLVGHHSILPRLVMSQSGSLPEASDKYLYDKVQVHINRAWLLISHVKDAVGLGSLREHDPARSQPGQPQEDGSAGTPGGPLIFAVSPGWLFCFCDGQQAGAVLDRPAQGRPGEDIRAGGSTCLLAHCVPDVMGRAAFRRPEPGQGHAREPDSHHNELAGDRTTCLWLIALLLHESPS